VPKKEHNMPCIKCMSKELREIILSDAPREIIKELEDVDICLEDKWLEFESGKKGKRKPSKYNQFIGTCMKDGNGMKDCAGKWRSKKREGENK